MTQSILIYGSGAMACLTAAHLASVGIDVTLLDSWENGIKALQNGVTIISPIGDTHTYPVHAHFTPSTCPTTSLALILVKSWQTAQAANAISQCLAPDGIVVTLQNGLNNLEILQKTLGTDRVRTGSATFGATLLSPGRVRTASTGTLTLDSDARLNPLEDCFFKAGFSVERNSDMRTILWRKALINAAINPITALLGIPNGQLIQNPHLVSLIQTILDEGTAVAAAEAIPFTSKDLLDQVIIVCEDTATNLSSMLQDVQRGAPTEIDAICGVLLSSGKRHNIPMPCLQTLTHLIHARTNFANTGQDILNLKEKTV